VAFILNNVGKAVISIIYF